MSPPSDAFSLPTASTVSPSSSVEFCHSTDVRVRDATYLCMLFIRSVNGFSGSAVGQYDAKMSYVLRPSSIASECSYQPAMAVPTSSSATGFCQPPCSKPLSASSSGPPGACMTPSSVRNVQTMILRMVRSLRRGVDGTTAGNSSLEGKGGDVPVAAPLSGSFWNRSSRESEGG